MSALSGLSTRDHAARAVAVLRANDEVGVRGRHAIARAFVYAVLDLAAAVRGLRDPPEGEWGWRWSPPTTRSDDA